MSFDEFSAFCTLLQGTDHIYRVISILWIAYLKRKHTQTTSCRNRLVFYLLKTNSHQLSSAWCISGRLHAPVSRRNTITQHFEKSTTGQRPLYIPYSVRKGSSWRCLSVLLCVRRCFSPESSPNSCQLFVSPSLCRLLSSSDWEALCKEQHKRARKLQVLASLKTAEKKKAALHYTPIDKVHSSKLVLKTRKYHLSSTEKRRVGFSPQVLREDCHPASGNRH